MAIPQNAVRWDQPFDPNDKNNYVFEGASGQKPLLDTALGETIASYTLTLPAESAALGLTIETVAPYASAIIDAGLSINMWFTVSAGFQSNAAFDGEGTDLPVEVTIVTSSGPARTLQRTMILKVQQQ